MYNDMNFIKIIIAGLFSMVGPKILSQDVNFSQFNAVSSYYNPALTAAFNGNFRVSTIYRNQWIGLQDQPITSFCVSGDIKFNLGFQNLTSDYFGGGIYFLTDRTQIFDWNTNEIALLFSYHKLMKKSSKDYLSIGMGIGVNQRSVNYDNIFFEDQFDGIGKYNGTTSELLPPNIFARPELKLGLNYTGGLSRKLRLLAGLSMHYILKPDQSFYKDFDNKDYTGSKTSKSDSKINAIVNFIYQSSSSLDLYPRLLISLQGPHQIINSGISFRKSFYTLNQTAFHAGINCRIIKNLNSYIPADIGINLGFEIKDFVLGLQYDFGIRDAAKYAAPTHSFEITLSIIGNYDNEGFICPTF